MKRLLLLFMAAMTVMSTYALDYNQMKRGEFSSRSVGGVRSMADGVHYTTLTGGKVCKYSYKDGKLVDVLFDAADHKEVKGVSFYSISGDNILLGTERRGIYRRSFSAKHWIWNTQTKELKALSSDGKEQVVGIDPTGKSAAFVRDNNLFWVDLATLKLTQITTDGEFNHIINGHTDWVYEEEFATTKVHHFSPDGTKIAYMRSDESEVPQYSMTEKFGSLYPNVYTFKYPKAGERNSTVELWMYDLKSGSNTKVNTGEKMEYIPRFGWTPSGELYVCKTNRLQNHFDLVLVNKDNSPRIVYTEKNDRYVDHIQDATVRFLPDGDQFIVKSEMNGFGHLYLYSINKGQLGAITSGDWEVTSLIDVVGDRVYYYSKERSPLGKDLYSIKLNGKGKKLMTDGPEGSYSVSPSVGFKYYIKYYSSVTTPNTVTLHSENGKLVRVLENNDKLKTRIKKGDVPFKEFFTFTTERGDELNGFTIKPVDFDPNKRYPVFMTQYSGPGSQTVTNSWGMDWYYALLEKGYIVVCVDGRGTGGRGAEFRKCTYGQLGKLEVEDQISAGRWVAKQPWAEPSRIGIYGWSYGGFMALNVILHGNDVFKTSIAVAPVTSWRYYDSIYTELYNGIPQDNAEGYDYNSPVNHADKLKGNLLIVHGTSDDNVHIQNGYAMINALVKAGKQFDTAIYPECNHGMSPYGGTHVRERMIQYVIDKL